MPIQIVEGADPLSDAALKSESESIVRNAQTDAGLDDRADGFGMQNLGAVISQLGDLGITDLGQGARVRNQARVGGHYAVDIRPDPDIVGGQHGPQDGG